MLLVLTTCTSDFANSTDVFSSVIAAKADRSLVDKLVKRLDDLENRS